MAKIPKSPQKKKDLEYNKDHFTFGHNSSRMFPRAWKHKKANINRTYRRRADELLAPAKRQISADDAEEVVGDLTVEHLQHSITRKRLQKQGTVSVGEKVRLKLEKRRESAGRKVNAHRKYDEIVAQAVGTLLSLDREGLKNFLEIAAKFLQGSDPIERQRIGQSSAPLDRALNFLEQLNHGNGCYLDALRRNRELCKAFQQWQKEAQRIVMKEARPVLRKEAEKRAVGKKLKAMRRQSEPKLLGELPT
jgi:hypothetical protein